MKLSCVSIQLAALAVALGAVSAPALAADLEITIRIKDHHFVPSEISAPSGQRIKFTVKNEDASPSEFESVDFHREKIIQPGREITVFVGPLESGTYEFFDDFHPDARGHLAVK